MRAGNSCNRPNSRRYPMGCNALAWAAPLVCSSVPAGRELSYNPGYARVRLRHYFGGMALLANAIPPSQAKREACQATGPARSLGNPACRRRLLSSMARPFLGAVTATLADCTVTRPFPARWSSFLDWHPRSRTPVANRCWSQRRSRANHLGTLSLRPPSHLYVHTLQLAWHGNSGYALVAAAALPFALYHRHRDPRAY